MPEPTLGELIRRARLAQGLTQQEVAVKVDVTAPTIGNWERGVGQPNPLKLKRLTRLLGKFRPSVTSKSDKSGEGSRPNTTAFGAWLRRTRDAAGLSVQELADASDLTAVAIYHLEAGVSQNPQQRTRTKLEQALGAKVPAEVTKEAVSEQSIIGLGHLTDFDPHSKPDWPTCAGVYVFYDVSDRPIYVGKALKIATRVADHNSKFWYRYPIVSHAAYIEIRDNKLRHQVEQVLIRFLKSNAVINQQSVDRDPNG